MRNKNVQASVAAALIFFGMVFLWLRENELRVSAEKNYHDLKFKLETETNEQANLANELQARIGDTENRLAETTAKYAADMSQKEAQVAAVTTERDSLDAQLKQANDTFNQFQAKSKEIESQYESQVNAKNKEVSELGGQLKEQAVKLETLYKEKASLEAKLMDAQKRLGALEVELAQAKSAAAVLKENVNSAPVEEKTKEPILD